MNRNDGFAFGYFPLFLLPLCVYVGGGVVDT